MTARYRRNARKPTPKPVVLPKTRDEQKVERLLHFGPSLKIHIPLHLWPAYQKVHQLEVLEPLVPAHERIGQSVLYVRRVAQPKPAKSSDLWQCLECADQPELLQPEAIKHMQTVHQIDTANATGTKNLTMLADGSGFYHHTWEYSINGMKFLRHAHGEKEVTHEQSTEA